MSQLPNTAALDKVPQQGSVDTLLAHFRGLVNMSRDAMATHYSTWDAADDSFRGIKVLDSRDVVSERKGEPSKMTVPLTHAQIMTFASFCFLLFTQNRTFFELTPTGDEDFGTRPDAELVLERDLKKSQFNSRLWQFLLDIARFGVAVMDVSWCEVWHRMLEVVEGEAGNLYGIEITGGVSEIESKVLRFEGNEVTNVSPYCFFPDTRIPLTDFQKGEFCAIEQEYTMTRLRELEADGYVNGVDEIQKMPDSMWKGRAGKSRFPNFAKQFEDKQASGSSLMTPTTGSVQSEGTVLVTKVQCDVVPSKYMVDGGDKALGPEKFKVRYVMWYANDQKVIRLERMNVLHGRFTYTLGQFNSDMHKLVNFGLPELVDKLQSLVSWYLNSHVRSVTNVIKNKLVVDPTGVESKSLLDPDSPFILIKKNASRQGVQNWVSQIKVQDVTAGHMGDAELVTKIMQVVTGINDNAQGQYNSGRRSATEARAVTAGAAGRLKTNATVIWSDAFEPMGQMMLTNSRQALSIESFRRIVGNAVDLDARFQQFKGTLEDIVGGDDFFVFDSTISSEKGFVAQSLQELLIAIISNPVSAQLLDLDARKLLQETMFLRGVTNLKRFSLTQNVASGETPPPPIVAQPPAALPAPGGAA